MKVETKDETIASTANFPVPRELPADVRGFTGRADALQALDAMLPESSMNETGAVVISAIAGTAGVGKTALAVHWAHQIAHRFPEGQLHCNLQGFAPETSKRPLDVLGAFLRALGMAPAQIPADLADAAARYRSLLADRRMLIVLDNARSAQQVRPLLPGSRGCLVLITSRDRLTGLVAQDGARRLTLDVLTSGEAVQLLTGILGADRVAAEPEATAALARVCAYLPLALRIAAANLADWPQRTIAEHVDALTASDPLIALVVDGDHHNAVRAALDLSYQALPTLAQLVFRRFGMAPIVDATVSLLGALTDITEQEVAQGLDQLADAHLVDQHQPGRYHMHDLLRLHAAGLAAKQESPGDRQSALTRLFDHYLGTATAAMNTLHPGERQSLSQAVPADALTSPVSDSGAALAWLNAERPNLVAVCAYTASHGWPSHTVGLGAALWRYLDRGGHYLDARTIHSHARQAAHHIRDDAGEARALTNLGLVHWRKGDYEQATEHFQQALVLSRLIGDQLSAARALTNLGMLYAAQGKYAKAADHLEPALTRFQTIGNSVGEAGTHNNLGLVYLRQGRYVQAEEHFEQTLAHSRKIGDRVGEAHALTNLGSVYTRRGHYARAIEHHRQALDHSRAMGDRVGEAHALTNLGSVYTRRGHYARAIEHHRQALAVFRQANDREGEADALIGLGEGLHATGHLEQARAQHAAALALAVEHGNRYEQARAHAGLGQDCHATGDLEQARHHWRQALAVYIELDVPEADTLRIHMEVTEPQGRTSNSP
jgi:tetratricopeptide (TPR) repeat protein